jgi:hypothetical protein
MAQSGWVTSGVALAMLAAVLPDRQNTSTAGAQADRRFDVVIVNGRINRSRV